MVGLAKGGAGVLGLRAVFLELVLNYVRSRKKRVRKLHCFYCIARHWSGRVGQGGLEF